MPALNWFGRCWKIGSDDFFFIGIIKAFCHAAWLIALIVVLNAHWKDDACHGNSILRVYYIGMVCLLSIEILFSILLSVFSARGTITDARPRRFVPIILYGIFILAWPEIGWNILGTIWAFEDSNNCSKSVVVTLKITIIYGWIVIVVLIISAFFLLNPKGIRQKAPRTVESLQSSSSSQIISRANSIWESRIKLLCCCLRCDRSNRGAFNDIANLISDFFKHVDVVPTDIVAGLVLMNHMYEKSLDHVSNKTHVVYDKTLVPESNNQVHFDSPPLGNPKDWMTIDNMAYYMKFASASYGWPLYMFTNICTGVCHLYGNCRCFSCCPCISEPGNIEGDNCCYCHTSAMKKVTGLPDDHIVYISYRNKVYEVPFFVVLDHQTQNVVVAVRGTLSFRDTLTDLDAEAEILEIDGVQGSAHKGILSAAALIKDKLENGRLLDNTFTPYPNYGLVVTGHSLGAGVASVLAILLKTKYPSLRCFAYSPPGGLISLELSVFSQEFICSVVLGMDIIPRLSVHNLYALKTKIELVIRSSSIPKYKILCDGCWRMILGYRLFNIPVENDEEEGANQPLMGGRVRRYTANDLPSHQQDNGQFLTFMFPPGQIFHITKDKSSMTTPELPNFKSEWTTVNSFNEIIICQNMISDHFPDEVQAVLEELAGKNVKPITINPSTIEIV